MGWFRDVVNLLYPLDPPSPVVPYSSKQDLLEQLNKERSKLGLGPLKLYDELNQIAQNWADRMAADNNLSHGDFAGRIAHVFPATPGAEDIAKGQPTVAAVVSAWMLSSPHRANILGNFTLLGVGKAIAKDKQIYWVVDFDREG